MIKLKDILLEAPNIDKSIGKWAFTGEPKKETPNSIWMGTDLTKDDALELYKKLAQLQGGDEEADTTEEEKILKLLLSWTNESDPMLADLLYSKLPTIKSAASRFPKVFGTNLSTGVQVFRGITNLSPKIIEQHLTLNSFNHLMWNKIKIQGTNNIRYQYAKPIKYAPRSKVQSWSTGINAASNFEDPRVIVGKKLAGLSGGDTAETYTAISGVLMTKLTPNEFFFSPEFMDVVWKAHGSVSTESETLHFGNKYSAPVYLTIHDNVYRELNKAVMNLPKPVEPQK